MADRDPVLQYWEAGQRIQERHEAYLLTLTFTLLALAVQTASFGTEFWRNTLELLGWVSLLASGLSGLSRTEWLSQLFGASSRKDQVNETVRLYLKAKLQGTRAIHVVEEGRNYPIGDQIQRAQERAVTVGKLVHELEAKTQLRYKAQRVAFLAGLLCLIVSRGWPALSGIVERFRLLF